MLFCHIKCDLSRYFLKNLMKVIHEPLNRNFAEKNVDAVQ